MFVQICYRVVTPWMSSTTGWMTICDGAIQKKVISNYNITISLYNLLLYNSHDRLASVLGLTVLGLNCFPSITDTMSTLPSPLYHPLSPPVPLSLALISLSLMLSPSSPLTGSVSIPSSSCFVSLLFAMAPSILPHALPLPFLSSLALSLSRSLALSLSLSLALSLSLSLSLIHLIFFSFAVSLPFSSSSAYQFPLYPHLSHNFFLHYYVVIVAEYFPCRHNQMVLIEQVYKSDL